MASQQPKNRLEGIYGQKQPGNIGGHPVLARKASSNDMRNRGAALVYQKGMNGAASEDQLGRGNDPHKRSQLEDMDDYNGPKNAWGTASFRNSLMGRSSELIELEPTDLPTEDLLSDQLAHQEDFAGQVLKMEQRLVELDSRCSTVRDAHGISERRCKVLASQLQEAKDQAAKAKGQTSELKAKVEAVTEQQSAAEAQVKALKEQVQSLQEQATEAQARTAGFDSREQALQSQNTSVTARLYEKTSQLEALQEEMQKEQLARQAQVEALENERAGSKIKEAEASSLRGQLQEAAAKAAAADAKAAASDARVAELEEAAKQKEEEGAKRQEEERAAAADASSAEAGALKERIAALEAAARQQEEDAAGADAAAKAEAGALKERIAALEAAAKQHEEKAAGADAAAKEKAAGADSAQAEADSLKERIAALEAAAKQQEEKAAGAEARAKAAEEALAKLQEEAKRPESPSSSTWQRKGDARDDTRELLELTGPSRSSVPELVFVGRAPAGEAGGALTPARLVILQGADHSEVTLVPLVPDGPPQKFDLADIVEISQPPEMKLAVDVKLQGADPVRIAMAELQSVGALLAALNEPSRVGPGDVMDGD